MWNVLAAVKTEFVAFGRVLDTLHKQLGTAQKTIAAVSTRKRAMDGKLRSVQSATTVEANKVLELSPDGEVEDVDDTSASDSPDP